MSKRRKKRKSSKAKRWGIIFAVELILILILIPVVFVYAKLSLVKTATADEVNKANIVINNDVDVTTQKALKGYRNIAFFGVDSRDGSLQTGARSDSIMVISINQETKDVKITSIYRDTCLKVPGYGFTKATHAYAYGGAELAMSMLNTNLDLDITEFATVDFGVLAKIIDAIGGIDLDISDAEFSLIAIRKLHARAIDPTFRDCMITRTSEVSGRLSDIGYASYEAELYASRLYRQILRNRSLKNLPDITSEPVILI